MRQRPGLMVAAVALVYCAWLGGHWLALDYSDKELAAFVSRLWDIRHELVAHHRLPWWTPWYMSGSSYGLNHSQGFYLVPSLLLSTVFDLRTAVKLSALLAIFGGTLAMYGCARYFFGRGKVSGVGCRVSDGGTLNPEPRSLKPEALPRSGQEARLPGRNPKPETLPRSEPEALLRGRHLNTSAAGWAAALAALAWLFHPEQVIRAAGAEHLGIMMFLPFVPLTWWTFARALDTGKFRDAFWCALAVCGGMWAHNKMMFVNLVFLAGYLGYRLIVERASRPFVSKNQTGGTPVPLRRSLGTCALTGLLAAVLGAFFIIPGLTESKYVKLFAGDPIREWQKNYAFRSLLGLADRDGVVTREAIQGVLRQVQVQGGLRTETELEQVRRVLGMQMDAPEKYAGLVFLALLTVTILWNRQRIERGLFWFFLGALLVSVMLATGLSTVGAANWQTWDALSALTGVPTLVRAALFAALGLVGAFLVVFYRRKLTSPRKRLIAAGALVLFLFLPAFALLALVPFYSEVRAPYVFYDAPAIFLGAMLAGFFVTDVLPASALTPDTRHLKPVAWVAGLALLLLLDYWPYRRPMLDSGVPASTLTNLRAAYGALQADHDWVKTYTISGRYFHLLGPMESGKPQVYEAFYNWMCPLGTGLLNQQASGSIALLNLLGTRYLVFDKSDPGNASPPMQKLLQSCRQALPVAVENADFAVFRNAPAHPYLSAFGHACLFVGDFRQSAQLSLALSERGYPLIQATQPGLATVPPEELARYDRVYVAGGDIVELDRVPLALRGRVVFLQPAQAPVLPAPGPGLIPLADLQLTRAGNGEVRARFTASQPVWLTVAESWYPFWTATLDGQATPIARVSTGLMGLAVGAGAHELVLRYEPPVAYRLGAVVSGLGLLAGLAVVGVGRWRRSA